MATLATSNLTLADWAKRLDPEGKIPVVAELLSQSNEILQDAVFKEGNLPTGERVVIRTGLPSVYWRSLNQGIPSSKSTTAQVDESCGILEAFSEIDKDLVELQGNAGQFRLSEDTAFLEAMNQQQAGMMFYGNPATNVNYYLGLAPRYSSLSAGNSANVISAGGSTATANTSIYLVNWSDNSVYCTFPKGSKAGLVSEDLGINTAYNVNGVSNTRMQVYQTRYQWKNGLVVKDWRMAARIANIYTTDLINQSSTQATSASTNIIRLMSRILDRIPYWGSGKPCFYMNRTVYSGLRLAAMDKASYVLKVEEGLNQFGTPQNWLSFEGIPIRRCDQILNTEAVVS